MKSIFLIAFAISITGAQAHDRTPYEGSYRLKSVSGEYIRNEVSCSGGRHVGGNTIDLTNTRCRVVGSKKQDLLKSVKCPRVVDFIVDGEKIELRNSVPLISYLSRDITLFDRNYNSNFSGNGVISGIASSALSFLDTRIHRSSRTKITNTFYSSGRLDKEVNTLWLRRDTDKFELQVEGYRAYLGSRRDPRSTEWNYTCAYERE